MSNINTSSILEAAREYTRQGFTVIPIKKGKKETVIKWEEYQERRPTLPEIDGWWGNGAAHQLAIVCGKVSGYLVVFDFDGPGWSKLYGDFIERYPEFRTTRVVITGSDKVHLYVRCTDLSESVTRTVKDFGNTNHIELRSNSHYVLAPPSIHPSGGKYHFESEQVPIIEISQGRLDEIISWLREPVKPNEPAQSAGSDVIKSETKPQHQSVNLTSQQKRSLSRYMTSRLIDQCRGGANRNDKGYELARYLNDLGLEIHEAAVYMGRFGGEVPQWKDKEPYSAKEAFASLESAFKNDRDIPWIPPWLLIGENLTEEQEDKLLSFNLTDAGNAESFLYLYGDQYVFIRERNSWFKWDEIRWKEDNESAREDILKVFRLKNRLALKSG